MNFSKSVDNKLINLRFFKEFFMAIREKCSMSDTEFTQAVKAICGRVDKNAPASDGSLDKIVKSFSDTGKKLAESGVFLSAIRVKK
ncbi:MAG: hypothetical protein LBD20_02990 [Spirochaetaceae bacterium]|jgi:predicted YcjX-like family ATPase|nr:hypothetical protein [Spirochaetaceae bacterium]